MPGHLTIKENSMIKTVIGSFDTLAQASDVARDLRAAGFLDSDINVIAHSGGPGDPVVRDKVTDDDTNNAAVGAVAGGALGGAAGLAVSIMGIAIPGIGPILAAGPIVAALAGAGTGAVAGGLIGGLTELGVPESEAEYYAESVRRGGAVVTVRVDESRADEAEAVLDRHGAIDIKERVERWRGEGWSGYDPEARLYSADEISRDRARLRTAQGTETALRR
jgi:hypothetical protein